MTRLTGEIDEEVRQFYRKPGRSRRSVRSQVSARRCSRAPASPLEAGFLLGTPLGTEPEPRNVRRNQADYSAGEYPSLQALPGVILSMVRAHRVGLSDVGTQRRATKANRGITAPMPMLPDPFTSIGCAEDLLRQRIKPDQDHSKKSSTRHRSRGEPERATPPSTIRSSQRPVAII